MYQFNFSMSGNFQLLSMAAFSGPYKRNHVNHGCPAGVSCQFDSCAAGAVGPM